MARPMTSEWGIISECERLGVLYEDPYFRLADACTVPGAQWRRPAQAFGRQTRLFAPAGRGTAKFVMGSAQLPDTWLLDALAALATRPALLERVFVSTRGSRYGVYSLQFFVGDEWVQMTIDDRLPCDERGVPLYARSGIEDETWVSLVEKAWAKLLGGYDALLGGYIPHALHRLTGEIPLCLALAPTAPPPGWASAPKAEWDMLLERIADGAPVMLYRRGRGEEAEETGPLALTEGEKGEMLAGFGYPVLQARVEGGHRLLEIGFPWRSPPPPELVARRARASILADDGPYSATKWITWEQARAFTALADMRRDHTCLALARALSPCLMTPLTLQVPRNFDDVITLSGVADPAYSFGRVHQHVGQHAPVARGRGLHVSAARDVATLSLKTRCMRLK